MKQMNMKFYNKVFFPIVAALIVILTVVSFLFSGGAFMSSPIKSDDIRSHINGLGFPRNTDALQAQTLDYIKTTLSGYGISEAATTVDDNTFYNASTTESGGVRKPTFTVHNGNSVAQDWYDYTDADIYGKTEYSNVVVILPGSGGTSGQASVIISHYDTSSFEENGVSDNALPIAAMLETVKALMNEERVNDTVFLFADESMSGGAGTLAFFRRFKGFDDVVKRLQFAANFDLNGNKGTVTVSKMSKQNSSLLRNAYRSGMNFNSIDDYFAEKIVPLSDMAVINIPAFNVSATDRSEWGTSYDTLDNLKDSFIRKASAAIYNTACFAANANIEVSGAATESVYFSYLGIGISYPRLLAILLTILTGVLAVLIVGFNFKKKTFSFVGLGKGAAAALAAVVASAAVIFVVYSIFALLMSGYSIISIQSFFALTFSSSGLLAGMMLVAVASIIGFSLLFKSILREKSVNIMYGGAFITAITAIFMGIFLPELSFALMAYSTLQLAVLFTVMMLKDKFKAKHGVDINRLYMIFVPFVISLPLIIASLVSLGTAMGVTSYLVSLIFFALILSPIATFFSLTDKVFDSIAQKLPERKVRVLSVTEKRVEVQSKADVKSGKNAPKSKGKNAPKPKTKVVKVKEITTEKRPIKYKNTFSVAVLYAVAIILTACFLFGAKTDKNYSVYADHDIFYEDALVFHIAADGNRWEVKDINIFRQVSTGMPEMEYDSTTGFYTLSESSNARLSATGSSTGNHTYAISPASQSSLVKLDFKFSTLPEKTFKVLTSAGEVINIETQSSKIEFTIVLEDVGGIEIVCDSTAVASIGYTEYNTREEQLKDLPSYDNALKFDPTFAVPMRLLVTRTFNMSV